MKNYERALYFYEVALSTPALTMSYIMLEAYKKFILVSLILNGRVSQDKIPLGIYILIEVFINR